MNLGETEGEALDHIQTVYGDRPLAEEVRRVADYVAVVAPIAWQMCRAVLPVPERILAPTRLEQAILDKLAASIPKGVGGVVGIGGGTVMDAAKYLALRASVPLLLAPSTTSSNAPFSDTISVRRAGAHVGMIAHKQPRRVVVDYRLIERADPRLNRAGYADLLAHDIALRDWRQAVSVGEAAWNEDAATAVADVMEEFRAAAPLIARRTDPRSNS